VNALAKRSRRKALAVKVHGVTGGHHFVQYRCDMREIGRCEEQLFGPLRFENLDELGELVSTFVGQAAMCQFAEYDAIDDGIPLRRLTYELCSRGALEAAHQFLVAQSIARCQYSDPLNPSSGKFLTDDVEKVDERLGARSQRPRVSVAKICSIASTSSTRSSSDCRSSERMTRSAE
jgi:hypothetical protein